MPDVEALGHRHPEARRLRELLRDPAARRSEQRFVLEGPRLVGDAVARGVPLEAVYLGPGARRAFADLFAAVIATGCSVRELKDGVLEKVGSTQDSAAGPRGLCDSCRLRPSARSRPASS